MQGLKLLDITVMLAPVISSWLSAVGIKLESYAASAVAADAQAGNRSWAPLARLSGVLCSSSVVDLFYVIVNGVDKVAARAMVNRPPAAAVAAAEAVAAAAGGAIRCSSHLHSILSDLTIDLWRFAQDLCLFGTVLLGDAFAQQLHRAEFYLELTLSCHVNLHEPPLKTICAHK